MTSTDDSGIEPVEIWDEMLRDRREVTRRDSTIVVTHRITTTSPTTVQFQILDPLPAEFDIAEFGFHPDFEPGHGRIGPDRVVISGVAEPEQEIVVKYGIQPERQPRVADIEALQGTAKPSIEMSIEVVGTETDPTDLKSAAMTRSSSEVASANTESDDRFSDIGRRLEERESDAWGSDVPAQNEPEDDSKNVTSQIEFDETESPTDDSSYIQDLFDEDVDTGSEEPPEQPIQYSGHGDDPFGKSGSDASVASSIASSEGGDTDEDADESATATEASSYDDGSVVEALISELHPDHLTDEQRRQFGEQLREVLSAAEQDRRSTTVRLAHLESQLQRFESYADAMGAIIDEHGPAEEFLSEVREDISSVEAMIDQLHRDMETASDARNSQRKRLNALDDEVTTLDSRQERLRDRFESLRSGHRHRTAELDERLTEVEPAVQLIDDLETEVASLEETTASLEARLEAVVKALTSTELE